MNNKALQPRNGHTRTLHSDFTCFINCLPPCYLMVIRVQCKLIRHRSLHALTVQQPNEQTAVLADRLMVPRNHADKAESNGTYILRVH